MNNVAQGIDIIERYHELITSGLNDALRATDANLVNPFHFHVTTATNGKKFNTISGFFTFANGAQYPWSFSGNHKTLVQLEREMNMDLVHAFFHNQLAKGLIKTRHLFKIQNMEYFNPSVMVLLVSRKGFFEDYQVVRIDLDIESSVYDFKTGRLNVKKIDEIVGEALKSQSEAVSEEIHTFGDLTRQLYLKRIRDTGLLELENRIPLKRRRVKETSEATQMPFVLFENGLRRSLRTPKPLTQSS